MHPVIAQNVTGEHMKEMQARTMRRHPSRVAGRSRRSLASAGEEVRSPSSPANADRIQRRRLEKSVSRTVPERLRFLWYWFCLTVNDIRRM
jgi:hypothetical protein